MVVLAEQRSVERALIALGWLHLLYGASLTAAASLYAASATLSAMMFRQPERIYVEPVSLLFGLLLIFGAALPSMITGYGLLDRAAWAQGFARRVSLVNLLVFPVGTALGAWTYFTLRRRAAEKILGPAYRTVNRRTA